MTNTYTEHADGVLDKAKPTRQRYLVVVCLFIGIVIAYIDRVNVSVLSADAVFLADMGIQNDPVRIGLLMTAFLAVYGLSNVLLAPLADHFGPRRTMMFSIIIWTISLFIGGVATCFSLVIISRILLALGEGCYYPLQGVFVKHWFPRQERGKANSVWVIGQSVAPAAAMPFFTWIVSDFGWRMNYYVCLVLGLIPLYMLWKHVTDYPAQHERVNEAELALIEAGQDECGQESKESIPFMERIKPFARDYRYWLLVLFMLCLQAMYWGLVAWLPKYLKDECAFSWAEMGWLAAMPFVLSIFSKALSGVLVDKVGRGSPILLLSMSVAGVCVYYGTAMDNNYASACLLAVGMAFCTMGTPVVWTMLQGIVPGKSISTAGGILNGIASGLSSLSPAVIGLVISLAGDFNGGILCLSSTAVVAAMASVALCLRRV